MLCTMHVENIYFYLKITALHSYKLLKKNHVFQHWLEFNLHICEILWKYLSASIEKEKTLKDSKWEFTYTEMWLKLYLHFKY